jgi:hypothetical protein
MEMAVDRLTTGQFRPVFTDEFILVDVNINPDNPRRFFNYSGDLSGIDIWPRDGAGSINLYNK